MTKTSRQKKVPPLSQHPKDELFGRILSGVDITDKDDDEKEKGIEEGEKKEESQRTGPGNVWGVGGWRRMDMRELAEQMTVYESLLFSAITFRNIVLTTQKRGSKHCPLRYFHIVSTISFEYC